MGCDERGRASCCKVNVCISISWVRISSLHKWSPSMTCRNYYFKIITMEFILRNQLIVELNQLLSSNSIYVCQSMQQASPTILPAAILSGYLPSPSLSETTSPGSPLCWEGPALEGSALKRRAVAGAVSPSGPCRAGPREGKRKVSAPGP